MEIEATPLQRFGARAVIASLALVTVYGLATAAWLVVSTLLILYLAVIAGIGLRGAAEAIARRTPLGVGPALGVVVLLGVGLPVGAGFVLGPQLGEQAAEAEKQLPELEKRLDSWVSRAQWRVQEATGTDLGATRPPGAPEPQQGAAPAGEPAPQPEPAKARSKSNSGNGSPSAVNLEPGGQGSGGETAGPTQMVVDSLQSGTASQIFGWIAGFVGGVSQGALGILLVSVIGVYLASSPGLYQKGLVLLVPIPHRPRVRRVMSELAGQLRAWIVAQLVAMVIVGLATTIGLLVIGVPLALLLGLLAGLLDFVPNFGPAIAAVPAVLVAAGEGKIVPVLVLYGVIQVAEGWLLRPLIEKRAVDTPPAVLLASQVVMGTIVGFMGLLTAPALVVLFTLVIRRFYVEDFLGDDLGDDEDDDHSKRSASTGSSRDARHAG